MDKSERLVTEPEPTDDTQLVADESRRDPVPDESPPMSPILAEYDIGFFDLAHRLPPIRPRVALVLTTGRGEVVFSPQRQPNATELMRKRIRSICEVDMGQHQTTIDADLPSEGDVFGFHAVIDMYWRVEDPARVVRDGVRDVRAALVPPLLACLRGITRGFSVERPEAAEREANYRINGERIGTDLGLHTTILVRLAMDNAVRERIRLESRVQTYRDIIASGDLGQFALRLAQRPKDAARVVELLVKERDAHRTATVDFVTRLIESGAVDRWEIDDQVRTVLQWLQDNTRTVITGTDETRQFTMGNDINNRARGNSTAPTQAKSA
jgi:hypothetical protein